MVVHYLLAQQPVLVACGVARGREVQHFDRAAHSFGEQRFQQVRHAVAGFDAGSEAEGVSNEGDAQRPRDPFDGEVLVAESLAVDLVAHPIAVLEVAAFI